MCRSTAVTVGPRRVNGAALIGRALGVPAGPCVVDVSGTNFAASPTHLLRLSPEEREAGSSEFLGEGYANADDNSPNNRGGNNDSYEGKHRVCSDKRA